MIRDAADEPQPLTTMDRQWLKAHRGVLLITQHDGGYTLHTPFNLTKHDILNIVESMAMEMRRELKRAQPKR